MIHKDTVFRVKVKGLISVTFNVQQGLRQGYLLSTTLLSLLLDNISRKIEINRKELLAKCKK